ncbi:hypothetical protein RN001_006025 [Aquatica leii]|uniref:DUF4806 domain-containing protein n=1 Tax=Aquatica leii TaxID=1421715 RepID=A0AAN7SB01_9COLE|nr:hypothetical protein RN001_006025 [Aquatica leii]
MQIDGQSTPSSGWSKMYCTVKRRGFCSYDDANGAISDMDSQDIDSDQYETSSKKQKRIEKFSAVNLNGVMCNLHTAGKMCQSTSPVSKIRKENHSQSFSRMVNDGSSNFNNVSHSKECVTQMQYDELKQLMIDFNLELQKQHITMRKIVSSVEAKVDELLKKRTVVEPNGDVSDVFHFTAINNETDFRNFNEKLLNDEEYFGQFVQHMKSKILPHHIEPIDRLYDLNDNILTRNFQTQCSWTGGRTKGHKKLALKLLNGFNKALLHIIINTNAPYNKAVVETFYKNILKNATSRAKTTNTRRSSQHRYSKRAKNVTELIGTTDKVVFQNNENVGEYEVLKMYIEENNGDAIQFENKNVMEEFDDNIQ